MRRSGFEYLVNSSVSSKVFASVWVSRSGYSSPFLLRLNVAKIFSTRLCNIEAVTSFVSPFSSQVNKTSSRTKYCSLPAIPLNSSLAQSEYFRAPCGSCSLGNEGGLATGDGAWPVLPSRFKEGGASASALVSEVAASDPFWFTPVGTLANAPFRIKSFQLN